MAATFEGDLNRRKTIVTLRPYYGRKITISLPYFSILAYVSHVALAQ